MEDLGKFTPYKRNRQIKINDKLKFIDIAKKKGNGEATRLAGITTKSILLRRQNEIKFKQIQNPNEYIILHKENPKWTINEDIDKSIYDWIDFNRSLGKLYYNMGFVEIIKRDPNLKELKPCTMQKKSGTFFLKKK